MVLAEASHELFLHIFDNQSFIFPHTPNILRLPSSPIPAFIHMHHKSSNCSLALQSSSRLLFVHPFITALLIPFTSAFRPKMDQKQSEMMNVGSQAGNPVWDKPVDVDEKWIQFVDDNVLASEPLLMAKSS